MSAYFIVEIKTKAENKQDYAEYVGKVRSIVEKYKGRYLSRGGKVTSVFGKWEPERIILIEFPSVQDIKRWLNSSEYKQVAKLRENSVTTKAIIVEGIKDGE